MLTNKLIGRYTTAPYQIDNIAIKSKDFSFSPSDHRDYKLAIQYKPLKKLIDDFKIGSEIGSANYVENSSYRFIKTRNTSFNLMKMDESVIEFCVPIEGAVPIEKESILIAKDGAGNGLGDTCIYKPDPKFKDFIASGILAIEIKDELLRYYILGILSSYHFKEFMDNETPGGSTIRHAKKLALEYQVPIFDKDTIKFISALTHNIVDKQEKMKSKMQQIDRIIEKELMKSQNDNTHTFSYPTIEEIKVNNFRLDTGLYNVKSNQINFMVENYSKGYKKLLDLESKILSGSTPEVKVYVEEDCKPNYLWIAVADISYGMYYNKRLFIRTNEKITNLLRNGDILITRKGATLGKLNMFFHFNNEKAFVNEDIKVLRINGELYDKIFTACFLNSKYGQSQLISNGSKGTKRGITNADVLNVMIPQLPTLVKKNISNLFYQYIPYNNKLNINDYLEKEQARNSNIGIYQLNMESMLLMEKLQDIVYKVVNNDNFEIHTYIESMYNQK